MEMIEYEQQDYDVAKKTIELGFFVGVDKKTLQPTEENIVEAAKQYYILRMRTFDPKTGDHL
jgi:hypothetical protein